MSAPCRRALSACRSSVRAKAGDNEVQINRLLDVLLSRVVFVQSWADAVDAALAHPEMTIITGDGDKFASSGLRIGASGVTAAALEEAQRRAERAADALKRAETDLATATCGSTE